LTKLRTFLLFLNCPTKVLLSTREATYIQRNTEARLLYHCYSGKAVSITYYECVCVALRIQDAMHMRHIVI